MLCCGLMSCDDEAGGTSLDVSGDSVSGDTSSSDSTSNDSSSGDTSSGDTSSGDSASGDATVGDTTSTDSSSGNDTSSTSVCGNGVVESGEACDDGNTEDCDGGCLGNCSATVVLTGCGDGVVCDSEVCDDGADNGTGACIADCSAIQVCGDNTVNGTEACDDGDTVDGNGCVGDCSYIEVGYACPEGSLGEPLPGACTFVGGTSIKLNVSFQYDPQPSPTDPAVLNSITIDGNVFDLFVVPTGYEMTQLGWDGHASNSIYENGSELANRSDDPDWDTKALAAFQDVNLNHYFESNSNGRDICGDYDAIPTTDAQKQSLLYDPPIPANAGGVVAITERHVNNCYHIAVYGNPPGGGPEELLGRTYVHAGPTQRGPTYAPPVTGSDYWASGRVVAEGDGTIGIALFPLSDLALPGYEIQRVELTASTTDHGDGKFFILQTYARNEVEFVLSDVPFDGDSGKNDNVPGGSTYSLVSDTDNGELTLNSDGTYTYTSDSGYTGTDTFTYEVCLPAPNDTTCEQATVTLNVGVIN